jgi:hypothetical protein
MLIFPGLFLAGTFLFRQRRPAVMDPFHVVPPGRRTLLSYRPGLPDFDREVARARRYPHPLAILVLRPERGPRSERSRKPRSSGNGNGNGNGQDDGLANADPNAMVVSRAPADDGQHDLSRVGFVLCDYLRELDVAAFDAANNQFVLLLTETNRTQAESTRRRLEQLVFEHAGMRLHAGIAEFESDGLILEDLIQRATLACSGAARAELEARSRFKNRSLNAEFSVEEG